MLLLARIPKDWCLSCHECSTHKSLTHPRRTSLGTIQAGYPRPVNIMAVDHLGPLPEPVMVVGDYFSKWTKAIPLLNQKGTTVACHLIDEVFMRFLVPEHLHSDQASQFESQLISEVCKVFHIKKTRTTPLLNMLATHCSDHPWDWEQHI